MRRNALELNPQVKLLLVGLTAALWVHSAVPAQAHGAKIEVLSQAVEIIATFETGEPMDNAQVVVYAPDTPDAPWEIGQTDSDGRFSFSPDTDLADGLWEVTVRKGGHGQTTSFSLGDGVNSRATTTSTAQLALQKWLSIVAIIWGFIGTALFFSKTAHKGDGHPQNTGKSTEEAALETAQTADNRATMAAAGFDNDEKTTTEEYR